VTGGEAENPAAAKPHLAAFCIAAAERSVEFSEGELQAVLMRGLQPGGQLDMAFTKAEHSCFCLAHWLWKPQRYGLQCLEGLLAQAGEMPATNTEVKLCGRPSPTPSPSADSVFPRPTGCVARVCARVTV